MKSFILILIAAGLLSTKLMAQEFTANPNADKMIVNIKGKKHSGLGDPDGDAYLIMQRSTADDEAFLQFNANPHDNNIHDKNLWEFGLRGTDELGLYYTEDRTLGTAMKFRTSAATPSVSFGASDYLARLTVQNDLFGQKGIYSTASGTGIYGESTANSPGSASGPGVHGKSTSKEGVKGESEQSHGVSGSVVGTAVGQAGVFGEANFGNHYGVHGKNHSGIGVYGEGSEGFYGVYGTAGFIGVYGISNSNSQTSRGVLGSANSGIGVRGVSTNHYGVMGETQNTDSYAGYFQGDVYTTGVYQSSDAQLKSVGKPIESATQIVKKLRPKTYQYKRTNHLSMHLPAGVRYGLIAQEVEQVLPHLVKVTKHDPKMDDLKKSQGVALEFKAVNYMELIPILIAAVQEQQQLIEELKNNH